MKNKVFLFKDGKFVEIGTTSYMFNVRKKIIKHPRRGVYQWKNYPEYCLNPNYNKVIKK